MQKETFGPVLPIATFKSLDEAIEMANDCEYGLTSSIYTTNLSVAMRAANELKVWRDIRQSRELRGHAGIPRRLAQIRHRRRRRKTWSGRILADARRLLELRPQPAVGWLSLLDR